MLTCVTSRRLRRDPGPGEAAAGAQEGGQPRSPGPGEDAEAQGEPRPPGPGHLRPGDMRLRHR